MSQNWTWDEYETIRKEYPSMGNSITEALPGRTLANIKSKAERLNTCVHLPFTDEEKELANKYGASLGTALMFLMPNHTVYEVGELLK